MSTVPASGPLVLVIEPDGTARTERLPSGDLAHSQRIVGGWVRPIGGQFDGAEWVVYVNDDGHAMGQPDNRIAHALATILGFRFLPGDHLTGPAVFLGRRPGADGPVDADVPAGVLQYVRAAGILPDPTEEGDPR